VTANRGRSRSRGIDSAPTPKNERPALLPPKGPVSLLTPYVPRHLNVPLYAEIMKITNSLVPNVRTRAHCVRAASVHVEILPSRTAIPDRYRKLPCVMLAEGYGGRKRTVMWNTFSMAISKLLVKYIPRNGLLQDCIASSIRKHLSQGATSLTVLSRGLIFPSLLINEIPNSKVTKRESIEASVFISTLADLDRLCRKRIRKRIRKREGERTRGKGPLADHLFPVLIATMQRARCARCVRHLELRRATPRCSSVRERVEGQCTKGEGRRRATTRASAKLVFQIIISRYCVLRRSFRGGEGGGGDGDGGGDVAAAASSTWPVHAA